jgi:DUF1680 family protein
LQHIIKNATGMKSLPCIKKLLVFFFLHHWVQVGWAQSNAMQLFTLSEVRLLESPFKEAEQTDLKYMLQLEPDRLLAPFLREAGLSPKAASYGNWESDGLDGHTAGHYLSALALMYASTGNAECKKRLDYMVSELARCQQKNTDGYVGGVPGGNNMWALVKTGDFSVYNKKWVPWYNVHKLFAGLRDGYLLAGNKQAKDVFIKLTDWAYNVLEGLSTEQIQQMLAAEHGGMNEVCADAAAITGDNKYRLLAEKFCHRAILLPLTQNQDKLNGLHANTQIPKVIGFERIAELNNDSTYHNAARFFWNTVKNNRSISIGGNSVREHFNAAGNFATMLESEQGPETCNSYNMLKLTKMLFARDPRAEYIEFYERLLYNHILSSQHPQRGGFVYFTPIHPHHYRVYSTADQCFWCCVGSGMENHGKYGELIYTHTDTNVYVNLFIPSELHWKEKGIQLVQHTKFPESEKSDLSLKLDRPRRFSLYIRKPEWIKADAFSVLINNQSVKHAPSAGEYIALNRVWKTGDRITVILPMKNAVEYLPGHSSWVSFRHGPVVLAGATDTTNLVGLRADGSRWGHIATGPFYPLSKAPLLLKEGSDLANALQPVNREALTFSISGRIHQPAFKNLLLTPFYKVHDTRYVLYWPVTSKDSIEQKQKELEMLDERYVKYASRTVDAVAPGEQQPETDHSLSFDKSETGMLANVHWRSASGYFSYRMRMTPAVKSLYIAYNGKEKGRDFDVYMDDIKIAHVTIDQSGTDDLVSREYNVPEQLKANKSVIIKFLASPGSQTASIYEVRLLR